jgi:hypothetical protein
MMKGTPKYLKGKEPTSQQKIFTKLKASSSKFIGVISLY